MQRRFLRNVLVPWLFAHVACAPSSSGVAQSGGASPLGTSGGSSGGLGSGSSGTFSSGTLAGAAATGAGASGTAGSGPAGPSGAMMGSGSTTTLDATSPAVTGSPSDAGSASATMDAEPITDAGVLANWVLWWNDEFDGEAGTPPNSKFWDYDLGGGGWGVGQLQTYTSSVANAAMDGTGNLAIVAIQDTQGKLTSARLKTQGKVERAYGRFETRAKVLSGDGLWPAFWMLGNNFPGVAWPQCGEIDIMEMIGSQPYTNRGSLHGPGYFGMTTPLTARYSLPEGGPTLADDFHTYTVEWETGVVRFYVDDNLYETRTAADLPVEAGPGAKWVFDHPFFILLNLGVGGHAGPLTGTVFPQTLLVDYVRVYERPDGGH